MKLRKVLGIWKRKNKGRNPEEEDSFYALVQRLDTLSDRMKRMLEFLTNNWKRSIDTSRFVEYKYQDTR